MLCFSVIGCTKTLLKDSQEDLPSTLVIFGAAFAKTSFLIVIISGQDPESLLINGKGQFRDPNTGFMTNTPLEVYTITPGRRYRFRMINSLASVCPAQLTFQGHGLTLIATDGEPVHPVQVNTVISFSGKFSAFLSSFNCIFSILSFSQI